MHDINNILIQKHILISQKLQKYNIQIYEHDEIIKNLKVDL